MLLGLGAVAWLLLVAPMALGQSIEGSYTLQGLDPDKTAYAGSVVVTKEGAGFKIQGSDRRLCLRQEVWCQPDVAPAGWQFQGHLVSAGQWRARRRNLGQTLRSHL
jgi:hypothetical protein